VDWWPWQPVRTRANATTSIAYRNDLPGINFDLILSEMKTLRLGAVHSSDLPRGDAAESGKASHDELHSYGIG
jgi:hypothetical protein